MGSEMCIRDRYGDGVELVSPAKERAEYLEEVRKMLRAYPEFAE